MKSYMPCKLCGYQIPIDEIQCQDCCKKDEIKPCIHLQMVIDALKQPELSRDFNDGYSDWVICHQCGISVCIDPDEYQWKVIKSTRD